MLVIRNAQLRAFTEAAVDSYVHSRAARIQRDDAEALVRDAVVRAKAYGIEDNAAVDRFLHLMLTVGSDFDANPDTDWMGKILQDANLDEHAKMDLIFTSPRLPAAARL